jgi:hypothetical protein
LAAPLRQAQGLASATAFQAFAVEPHCQVRTRSWFEYSVYRLGAEREGLPFPFGKLRVRLYYVRKCSLRGRTLVLRDNLI